MKSFFYHIKRAALALAIASTTLISAGCNRGTSNGSIGAMLATATKALVPYDSTPRIDTNQNKATIRMRIGIGAIKLTDEDKKALADNVDIGKAVDKSETEKGEKTEMSFVTEGGSIDWHVSYDESPGILRCTKYHWENYQKIKITSDEYYELSEASNNFAKEWLAAHPAQ